MELGKVETCCLLKYRASAVQEVLGLEVQHIK